MKRKQKLINKIKKFDLNKLGAAFNLSLSSYELFDNRIMGLDRLKRKLLVADENNGLNNPSVIDLSKVLAISIKKIYGTIKVGDLKRRRIEEFIEWIGLQFDFGNERELLLLPFYDRKVNSIGSISGLERKMRDWQQVLSEISNPKGKW